jgi:hypothetical protein
LLQRKENFWDWDVHLPIMQEALDLRLSTIFKKKEQKINSLPFWGTILGIKPRAYTRVNQ